MKKAELQKRNTEDIKGKEREKERERQRLLLSENIRKGSTQEVEQEMEHKGWAKQMMSASDFAIDFNCVYCFVFKPYFLPGND